MQYLKSVKQWYVHNYVERNIFYSFETPWAFYIRLRREKQFKIDAKERFEKKLALWKINQL